MTTIVEACQEAIRSSERLVDLYREVQKIDAEIIAALLREINSLRLEIERLREEVARGADYTLGIPPAAQINPKWCPPGKR